MIKQKMKIRIKMKMNWTVMKKNGINLLRLRMILIWIITLIDTG